MDKDNNHTYRGLTLHFATKHGKEEILAPHFHSLGMKCEAVPIDTDEFGTFSGEVERKGTIRETLRKKIGAAVKKVPNGRLFLASEGSFGPHPFLGFLQTDLESLLFHDQELGLEIYAEFLCLDPVHAERTLEPRDDFRKLLSEIGFPDHGVIVHPESSVTPVFKGLHTLREVEQAMLDCFMASSSGRVTLMTDLRANHNATRRSAIFKAGEKLVEKLKSFCPSCGVPGFALAGAVPGLKCEACGLPSEIAKEEIWSCPNSIEVCQYEEIKPRADGKKHLSPDECSFCNP